MSAMHLITKQVLGHELHPENSHKVEYHLKSARGRTVMTFDHEEHAKVSAKAKSLNLFKVTTIVEKIEL